MSENLLPAWVGHNPAAPRPFVTLEVPGEHVEVEADRRLISPRRRVRRVTWRLWPAEARALARLLNEHADAAEGQS
jgi:hypothetical protein